MTEVDDTQPDDPMTPDEEAAMRLLTPAQIQWVDDCLLSNVSGRWRKVARVFALTMPQLPDIPLAFLSLRVKHLAASGVIEAAGNLNRMRFSEIRKSDQGVD
ncbi:MAG TPA: DUF3658 domain-containing protein [Candidatus Angelobacter sp.]|nr:DUF3658 domain-containing protein [Candidatus Angelobacter sp.]